MTNISEILLNIIFRKYASVSHGLKTRYEVLKKAINLVNGDNDVATYSLTLIVDSKLFLKRKDQVFSMILMI